MSTISLSLAKPGEAMPAGVVQQLDGASPACVPERSRLGGRKEKTQDNADTALIRLLTSNKDGGTRHAVARAARASEKVSSSCSRRDRVLSNLGNHSGRRVHLEQLELATHCINALRPCTNPN